VLVVNRVKPHTSFHGPHESGLMKMLAVGVGRAGGAEMVHRLGWGAMVEAVESIGAAALKRLPVIGGLAIVENAREQTALVEGLSSEEIPAGESRLLEVAREYVPALRGRRIGPRADQPGVLPLRDRHNPVGIDVGKH